MPFTGPVFSQTTAHLTSRPIWRDGSAIQYPRCSRCPLPPGDAEQDRAGIRRFRTAPTGELLFSRRPVGREHWRFRREPQPWPYSRACGRSHDADIYFGRVPRILREREKEDLLRLQVASGRGQGERHRETGGSDERRSARQPTRARDDPGR